MTHRLHTWLAGLLSLLLLAGVDASAWEQPLTPVERVVLLASDDSTLHERVLVAMELRLRGLSFVRNRTIANTPEGHRILAAFDCSDCLVVASGLEALRFALDHSREALVLAISIPEETFEHVTAGRGDLSRLSGIYMDVSLGDIVHTIRTRLRNVRTVALVTADGDYLERERHRGELTRSPPGLVEYAVEHESDLVRTFGKATRDAQAILAVPDPRIYNRDTIVRIMLTTYRTGTPLIGYSEAMHRAGALMSVFATPEMLGEDAAHEITLAVNRGYWTPVRRHTRDFTVLVNQQVARSLGIPIRDAP